MSRFANTRAARWGVRQEEITAADEMRRASLKSNPRQIVENILSRYAVCHEVNARIAAHPGNDRAAIEFVAERIGIPVETVEECLSVEALETGK